MSLDAVPCFVWLVLLATLSASVGIEPARGESLTVFAAASVKTALDDIGAEWQRHSGHTLVVSVGASSMLARQIQQGAPADVFLSANQSWMDVLEHDDRIDASTRFDLLGNSLVLIAPDWHTPPVTIDARFDFVGRLGEARLAMAMVDAVPAGMYGKAALDNLGAWPSLADHIAQTDNVRSALALVALGETPLGIVYASDARAESRVGIVGVFPASSHPPIIYPVAAVRGERIALSTQFLGFLRSDTARTAFEHQGFVVLTTPGD